MQCIVYSCMMVRRRCS